MTRHAEAATRVATLTALTVLAIPLVSGLLTVPAVASTVPALQAQAPPPTGGIHRLPSFKRASITPSAPGGEGKGGGTRIEAGGKFSVKNATLRQLMQMAYRRHAFDRREITGGPAWVDSETFDLVADVGHEHVFGPSGFPRETLSMLQSVLEDRFKLKVRTESQPRPVYALALASSGAERKPGPRLRPSTVDCADAMSKMSRGEPAPKCGTASYPGRLVGTITLPDLATLLTSIVDRPVIDRTGLDGLFEVDVEAVEIRPKGPFGPSYRPSDTRESIFNTLPSQLGLKLEPVQGAIDVLVIDRAEMPAGD